MAARRRNGKPRLGEGCGLGDAEPGRVSWSRGTPRALREGKPAAAARWGRGGPSRGRGRTRRGRRRPGCVQGGWRGNSAPAPAEPAGREEDGPGRCSGTGAGRWECEGTATSALTTPAAASRRGKKLCLEERFAREPARAQLSRRPWRAWTRGARGHGGARGLGAAPCARYSPWGPPCGHPRGAWSVACGSRRPQTSAASLIWAAFLWAAQRSGVRAGGGGRGRGKTTSRMG